MWPDQIHRELSAAGVRLVGYVPDAGHKRLIELCQADEGMRAVVLSTEEEGIGLAAGAWLGGQKTALLMQSSGVGNIVNVLGMVGECRFPLVTLVTMRGEQGEFNPWQRHKPSQFDLTTTARVSAFQPVSDRLQRHDVLRMIDMRSIHIDHAYADRRSSEKIKGGGCTLRT
jgi:sulfopyruvate decarboxylase TPP-binding subunit